MQVTQTQDHVTHAVIGGKASIDFGISSSAEFFQILSSTLYQDQKLAVARETLCNAWDAHIEAGCTDRPVEVTVENDRMVFRDYGRGIPDDKMGPIYGTYGASTKKENGEVTGGFGLGCKAPFAYTDHFQVISNHAGTKTIYSLAKSSAEVGGKPGITQIASFPTTDTGLEVSIPIIDKNDADTFLNLIKQVAYEGDIPVLINGAESRRIRYEMATHGWIIAEGLRRSSPTNIFVRYGNVIYPVVPHPNLEFLQRCRDVLSIVHRHDNQVFPPALILVAAPNSLAITPSRETLSMQEHTIKALNELMEAFLNSVDLKKVWDTKELVLDSLKEEISQGNFSDYFLHDEINVRHLKMMNRRALVTYPIVDHVGLRKCAAYSESFSFVGKSKSPLKVLLRGLVANKLVLPHLAHSFYKQSIADKKNTRWTYEKNPWFYRELYYPMLWGLKEEKLSHQGFFIITPQSYTARISPISEDPVCGPTPHSLDLLRPVIILFNRKGDVEDRLRHFPLMKTYQCAGRYLGVRVGQSRKKIDELVEFFKKRRMHVIDLTRYHEWENAPTQVASAPVISRPAPTGLVPLAAYFVGGNRLTGDVINHQNIPGGLETMARPELVTQIDRTGDYPALKHFSRGVSLEIYAVFGSRIGVASSSTQLAKYVRQGSIDLKDYVLQYILDQVTNKADFREAIATNYRCHYQNRIDRHEKPAIIIREILNHDPIRQRLGIPAKKKDDVLRLANIWFGIRNERKEWGGDTFDLIQKEMEKITTNPALLTAINTLESNRSLLNVIDSSHVHYALTTKKGTELIMSLFD